MITCASLASHDFFITVPADHPAFVGHFPGHPVLPGVVLLAEVLAGVERCLRLPMDRIVIRVAKFHAPVSPGATLAVELVQGNGIVFTVASGETRVASGALALDPAATDPLISDLPAAERIAPEADTGEPITREPTSPATAADEAASDRARPATPRDASGATRSAG